MTDKTPRPIYEVTITHPGYDPNKPVFVPISCFPIDGLTPEQFAQTMHHFFSAGNPNRNKWDEQWQEIRKWAKRNKVACHLAKWRPDGDTSIVVRWWDAGAAALFKLTYGGAQ